jgi:ABC-type phosphate transport system substrate-binding protein
MIKSTASALALILGMLSGLASAQITYVGSTTIGEGLIPEAAKAFTAKPGIPFGSIEVPVSSKGLEMILRGEAQLADISRSLTLEEKQRRFYYRIIGYDAVGIYVHPANPVTNLTKQQLKAIHTGQITNWNIDGFAPEPQHIQSGAYLLSRPLLLVSQAHPPSAVKQFIDFLLAPEGQEIVARKFVSIR